MKVNKKTRKSGVESRNQGKEKRKYQQIKSRKKDMWLKTKKKKKIAAYSEFNSFTSCSVENQQGNAREIQRAR